MERVDIVGGWDNELIMRCTDAIKRDKILITPTDTLYGLAARAISLGAVNAVRNMKGSRDEKGFIVLAQNPEMIKNFGANIGSRDQKVITALAGLPVTFILQLASGDMLGHISGNKTIAVRFPSHKFLEAVLSRLEEPIISTSVNLSGEMPARTTEKISDKILSQVAIVVDEGAAMAIKPSTILDLTHSEIKILREGVVTKSEIEKRIGKLS